MNKLSTIITTLIWVTLGVMSLIDRLPVKWYYFVIACFCLVIDNLIFLAEES